MVFLIIEELIFKLQILEFISVLIILKEYLHVKLKTADDHPSHVRLADHDQTTALTSTQTVSTQLPQEP